MIEMSTERTKRMVAVHGWSGTVLGLLLYAVVLTGAVAVFAGEIGIWSRGGATDQSAVIERAHRHLTALARQVDPALHEEIRLSPREDGTLRIAFQHALENPSSGQVEDYTRVFYVDPETGETVREQTGFLNEVARSEPGEALERFLIDLHVRLYVPEPWGLFLTGILGLAMMAAAVSGFMIHRHLIRDLFTAPRGHGRLSDKRDRHVLAAAWGLPFSVLLAFTGAFLSFAISLGVPLVAMVAFGGDREALIETVLAPPALADPRPAPLSSLDYIVMDSIARAGAAPSSVLIERYGSDAARVTTFHRPTSGSLLSTVLVFDGDSRAFLGEKPTVGNEPSAGSAAVSLMAPLHFGNFAGLASKTAWLALGLAMSFVIATGMQLWVRRRLEEPLWRRFGVVLEITLWGLPIALMGSAVSFFLALKAGDPQWWTPAGFVLSALMVLVVGLTTKERAKRFRVMAAALCIGLPLLRHLTGGTSWTGALFDAQAAVLVIDLLLLSAGGLLLLTDPRRGRRDQPVVLEPAE